MPEVFVSEILRVLRTLAPFELAAEWDNVGLLAGREEWPARRVLLTLDLTDAVAREALRSRTDVVVAYHPPIFKGIRSVTPAAQAPTTLLPDLLSARVSIIALHTALDAAVGGTNDLLLDAVGVDERVPLEPAIATGGMHKLVVFVPAADADRLRSALAEAGAGVIGHYRECSFATAGRGTFLGDETTNPAIGRSQKLEAVDELRLEMVVRGARVGAAIRALYANHPYEEPAFDLIPLSEVRARAQAGMGRIGRFRRKRRGSDIVEQLGKRYDLSTATCVGDLRRWFSSVTAGAGSFGVRSIRDAESLFITGEFKHHDALELARVGVSAVCLGHYASERPVLDVVCTRLRQQLRGARVSVSRADAPPLKALNTRSSTRAERGLK